MIRATRRRVLKWLAVLPLWTAGPARASDPATQRYLCTYNECDPYVYDPLRGDPENINGDAPIPPGTPFEALPEDWLCPVCGSPLEWFVKTEEYWAPSAES